MSDREQRTIKVLMAKPGLDSHWRGIQVVSRALTDAGMEVVYGGNQTYAGIARIAADEDVDVIGLSILAPGYRRLIENTLLALQAADVTGVLILVGGIILKEDVPAIERSGVDRVFLPGTPTTAIVDYIQRNAPRTRAA